jgi:hypothetical protein
MAENKDEAAEDPKLKALEKQLSEIQRAFSGIPEQLWPDESKFKPGELTPEEEEFVKAKGLTAFTYIPKKTVAESAEATQRYNERIRTSPTFRRQELRRRWWRERFNHGYGIFIFGIAIVWLNITEHYDFSLWPIGAFWLLLMLTILEIGYSLWSRNFEALATILLASGLFISGWSFLRVYNQMNLDFKQKESWVAPPSMDQESISETGYIMDVGRETNFRLREQTIWWKVKIPSTNHVYWCEWASGYSKFSKNDIITLIHKEPGSESDEESGFIVGTNGSSAAIQVSLP